MLGGGGGSGVSRLSLTISWGLGYTVVVQQLRCLRSQRHSEVQANTRRRQIGQDEFVSPQS